MSSSSSSAEMQVRNNVRTIYSRMQTLLQRRPKSKRTLEISAPFDLKLVPVSLPGVSQDELTILREKATASRVGISEYIPRSSSSMTSSWGSQSPIFVYNRTKTPPHAHARRLVW